MLEGFADDILQQDLLKAIKLGMNVSQTFYFVVKLYVMSILTN